MILTKLKGSFRKCVLAQVILLSLRYRIFKYRVKAAVCIQKYIKGYLVRKDLNFAKPAKIALIVKWPDPADSVFIAGSFTEPPWTVQVPMRFSRVLKYFISNFFIDTSLRPGRYYLKFVVDGNWVCNNRMITSVDLNMNMNNVVEILKEKRYVPRPHSSRNLGPDIFRMSGKVQVKNEIPRVSSVEHNIIRPLRLHKEEKNSNKLKLVFGSFMAAHPKSRFAPLDSSNSADAYLANEELQIFGVADGVGEWETFGLDPGLFPKELMANFSESYNEAVPEIQHKIGDICPLLKDLLSKAYLKTTSYGSSTVLLGVLQNNTLYTICLGDSTYVILRPREKRSKLNEVFRLPEQQHSFNCPYQLARFPEPDQYEFLIKKGLTSFVSLLKRSNLDLQDCPQDANSEIFHLIEGDIIIAASDGLFDNLFDEDIIKYAETFLGYELSNEEYCSKLAKELVSKAVQKGWDMTYKSPFSKNAAKFGQRYIGGKLDDTTVVVALAVEDL